MIVREVALDTDTTYAIERAVSFDARLEAIWEVTVHFDPSLRTSAGRCGPQGITLHYGLKSADPIHYRDTFLHEVAHAMEWLLYRKFGHSYNWWEAMIRLGCNPIQLRRHSIPQCMKRPAPLDILLDEWANKP